MKIQGALIVAILGSFLICLIVLLPPRSVENNSYQEASTIGAGSKSYSDISNSFVELAKEKGPLYAFEVLRRADLPANTVIHALGHRIAEVLYKEKGIDGMKDCTDEFRDACAMSISSDATQEYGGESALEKIKQICEEYPKDSRGYIECNHGLGHGAVIFFKFDLNKTFEFCKKDAHGNSSNLEYSICVGGAIMELAEGGDHDYANWAIAQEKYFSVDAPLSPCMGASMPEEVRGLCLLYITDHLLTLGHVNANSADPSKLPNAFHFCASLSKQSLRDSCYGGFGRRFIYMSGLKDTRSDLSHYPDSQLARASSWCELAGAEDGMRACVAQELAVLFWGLDM